MNGFAIARYLSNGDLDVTFGEEGKVIIDMGQNVLGTSVRVGSDDSIFVCGKMGGNKIGIAHIRPNGELVSDTFGSKAKFTSSFMDGHKHPRIRKVLFAKRAELFVRGTIANENITHRNQPSPEENAVRAHTAPIDQPLVGTANSLQLKGHQLHGLRVLAVGDVGELTSPRLIAVASYTIHGNPDQSFSNDGQMVQHARSDKIEVAAAAYNSRQARTVVVTHKHDHDLPVLRIARFLDDGTLDGFVSAASWHPSPGTGNSGTPWPIIPQDVVFRNDIIIVGTAFHQSVGSALVVVRLKENGSVDTNFGEMGGVGFVPVPVDGSRSAFNSVEFDARSRIIVSGTIAASTISRSFCLARFNPNGKLDQDFNQNRMVITDFDGDISSANVAKIDTVNSERIVAAGEAGGQFALARYLENGSLDPTFGTNGKVRTTILSEHLSSISDIAFDSQKRIIAAGSANLKIIID